MTTDQPIVHCRQRARDSLKIARFAKYIGSPADALFHCHLAVKRALQAAVMRQTGGPHPTTDDLPALARLVSTRWSEEEQSLFEGLTDFAAAARHGDPDRAQRHAATEAAHWIGRSERFVSRLLP